MNYAENEEAAKRLKAMLKAPKSAESMEEDKKEEVKPNRKRKNEVLPVVEIFELTIVYPTTLVCRKRTKKQLTRGTLRKRRKVEGIELPRNRNEPLPNSVICQRPHFARKAACLRVATNP